MWRRLDNHEEVVGVEPGVSIAIPAGAHFQFRSISSEPLVAIGTTMPPWPGETEAVQVAGVWQATL
jgi:mannose-6-phosphate isomerase-like protein (cupin superfamily)